MKLNSAGGLLMTNVHNGPQVGVTPQQAHQLQQQQSGNNNVSISGHPGWSYIDGVPGVTSSSGLHDETTSLLDTKLGIHPDLPPDLTELKNLYPGADYPLTNDPHLPQMGLVRPYTNNNNNNNNNNHNSNNNNSHNNNQHHHNNNNNNNNHHNSNGHNNQGDVVFDLVSSSTTPMLPSAALIKSELNDYLLNSDIDDIAALIGSAIADSTVPTLGGPIDDCNSGVTSSTIDPWTELDAWIESACVIPTVHSSSGNNKLDQDNTIHTSDFSLPTLQNLLQSDLNNNSSNNGPQGQPNQMFHDQTSKNHEHFTSSILQSRLQQPSMRQDNNNNQRHLSSPQQLPESTTSIYGLKVDPYTLDPGSPPFDNNGLGSGGSDIQRPHTTHVSPPAVVTSTMGRYRKSFSQRKNYDGFIPPGFQGDFTQQPGNGPGKMSNGIKKRSKSSKLTNSATAACQSLEMIENGKEKPIHRCGICNRGFLNKSNIKVHLRTHTGEKPFKCDSCSKAFRQKAHLLKHVQIHKRLPRD